MALEFPDFSVSGSGYGFSAAFGDRAAIWGFRLWIYRDLRCVSVFRFCGWARQLKYSLDHNVGIAMCGDDVTEGQGRSA